MKKKLEKKLGNKEWKIREKNNENEKQMNENQSAYWLGEYVGGSNSTQVWCLLSNSFERFNNFHIDISLTWSLR